MNRCRRASWVMVVALGLTSLFLLLSGMGCSRHIAVPAAGATADHSQLPFNHPTDSNGFSPTSAFAFASIPARTELTVRLRLPLSSANSRSGDTFAAVIDEPLIQDGKTILPRGCEVTGRIVATKASDGPLDPGYLRLTLASIAVTGKSVQLKTSSIFAKSASHEKLDRVSAAGSSRPGEGVASSPNAESDPANIPELGRDDVSFSTGHRFTFRLTQPLRLQN